ncbi:hypothetical protein SUGI_1060720 [Cryptomeria japonica]|nr:hypothetical protein SUGI_1060720 [Cryptomeria japonica]
MKKLCMVELLNAKRIESMRSMREEEVSLAVRSVWEKSRHGKVAVNLSQIISSLRGSSNSRKQQQPNSKDIIDALLEMQAANSITITDEHVKKVVFNLFVAGVETTSTTLDWAMRSLIQNLSVGKKLQAEIKAVVAPLLIPHESTEACTIDGYFIPKRSWVFVSTWALGRDPIVWNNPLEFKLERFMGRDVDFIKGKEYFDVLPFGAGRRACPRATMAFAMLTLTISQLMHYFDWRVEVELDMSERSGASLPRKYDLIVVTSLRLLACP